MDAEQFRQREQQLADMVGSEALEAIDELVFAEPAVLTSVSLVAQARLRDSSEMPDLVAANRDIIDSTRVKFLQEKGLIKDLDKLEQASEDHRGQVLGEITESFSGDEEQEEVLRKFGLLDEDGHLGQDSIESPLFSRKTQLAFHTYMSAVKSHLEMVTYMQSTGDKTANDDAGIADQIRTRAHDRVAEWVAQDLGVDFEVARSLVAKMREHKLPQSGEAQPYATASMRIGKKYAEKYAGHTAWLVEDKTKPLFVDDKE